MNVLLGYTRHYLRVIQKRLGNGCAPNYFVAQFFAGSFAKNKRFRAPGSLFQR